MSRGRMVSRTISLDKQVNYALSCDTSRLLFTWLITHLDCEGRMFGDAQTIKSIVFPRRRDSIHKIEKYLNEMEICGLIFRYNVNGNQFLCMPNFEKHQTGLRKDKEAASQIPVNTTELGRSKDGKGLTQDKDKDKDKDKDNIFILYQQEIGKITASITDELKELSQEYPFTEIKRAFKIAATNNKRSLGYIKGILKKEGKKDAPAALLAGMDD